MNTAELLIRCLENEGVEYIFGLPGEENLQVLEALKMQVKKVDQSPVQVEYDGRHSKYNFTPIII